LGVITFAPVVANRFGRRACISAGGIIAVGGCIGCAYLNGGIVPVYFCWRAIIGFGMGAMCFAVPIYNSEVSTPGMRGFTGAFYQTSVCLGQLLGSSLMAFSKDWHLALMWPAIAAGVVALLVWTVPETPRWVLQKKGFDEGLAVLSTLRAADASEEAKEMEQKLNQEQQGASVSYVTLWTDKNLRYRVFVATWLQVAQKFTFIDAWFNYWSTICLHMHITDSERFSVIFDIPNLLGSIVSIFLMDTKCGGRKRLLLLASSLVFLSYVLTPSMSNPGAGKACMILYIFGWQLAWGSVCWLLPSELFSMAEKGPALAVPTFVQFAFNPFAGMLASRVMENNFSAFFYMGAGFMILHLIFILACVRETKGVPLEHVPALYGAKMSSPLAKASA